MSIGHDFFNVIWCIWVSVLVLASDMLYEFFNSFISGIARGFAFVEFEPNPEDEPAEKAFTLSGKVRIHAKKLLIDYAPDTVVCYKYVSINEKDTLLKWLCSQTLSKSIYICVVCSLIITDASLKIITAASALF